MDETCEQAGTFFSRSLRKLDLRLRSRLSRLQTVPAGPGRPDAELLQAEGGELLEALQHLVNQASDEVCRRGSE